MTCRSPQPSVKRGLGGRSKPALEREEQGEDKEAHRTPKGNGFPNERRKEDIESDGWGAREDLGVNEGGDAIYCFNWWCEPERVEPTN